MVMIREIVIGYEGVGPTRGKEGAVDTPKS